MSTKSTQYRWWIRDDKEGFSETLIDRPILDFSQINKGHTPAVTSVKIQNKLGEEITGTTVTIETSIYHLNAFAEPKKAAQKFSWKSSDANIAEVDSTGRVTFLNAGTVNITATAQDGSNKSASVTLTLNNLTLTGTCGSRQNSGNEGTVKYSINGNTIRFSNALLESGGSGNAEWDHDCGAVFKNNPEITIVIFENAVSSSQTKEMFRDCKYVRQMDLENLNISAATDMSSMFKGCEGLETLNINGWDTSNVTNMESVFSDCKSLKNLDVSKWNTSNVTNLRTTFYNCILLESLDVRNWNTSKVKNMEATFMDCIGLTNLDVSKWDTSNVENMCTMFGGVNLVSELDVSKWNTSKVKNMASMFNNCFSLTSLDVSKWDTSNVIYMDAMFINNNALTSLDVSKWNTSKAESMSSMFSDCYKLKTLDVSKWNTSRVTDMGSMFLNCFSLTSLDLGKWNTSKVTNIEWMFHMQPISDPNLSSLDLSGWDTSGITNMDEVFTGCLSLNSLTLGQNTVKKNIFTSLPSYNMIWFYEAKGSAATNPLPLKSAKGNGTLFTEYKAASMAGTWTVGAGSLAEEIILQDSSDNIITGKTIKTNTKANQLKAVAYPEEAAQTFTWTSSDTSIATVNSAGKVSFKKAGLVTITATAVDGSKKSAKVKIIYVPVLTIKDSQVKGYNKGIKILIPYEKNVSKYVVKEVYDVAAKKVVKPTVNITDSGKYTIIKLSGNGLVNGKVYRIKIYRSHTYNGKNYNSNTVTQYAAPNPTVSSLTVNPRDKSVVMTSNYKEKADGIQYRVYNGTTNKQVRTTVLSGTQKSGSIKELTNGEIYFAVVRTYKEYKGKKLWTMDSNKVYFVPLSKAANVKVTFSGTTAEVTMKKDGAATGIRVLYRGPDGKLVNGCEAKSTKCTVKNLNKNNAYEFYVMKYKAVNGKKHYGPGVLLRYKTTASGLAAPSKVVVESTKANTTFTITKASKANGISVLYRVNEGKFQKACEKAAASCSKKLDTSKNYTFYIMQYKVVSGKKVYSPGVTVKNWTGAKDAAQMAEYTVVNEAIDPAMLYDALDEYYTEEDLLRDEAYAVLAGIPTSSVDVPEEKMAAAGIDQNDSLTAENETLTFTVMDDARAALQPLFEGHALPATGFSSMQRTVLPEQPENLNYKPLQMRLQIPTLNADMELVKVPLEDEIWQVKWLDDKVGVLEGSAIPGKGYSVVAAHNTLNSTEYGPFALLSTLEENDTIMVSDRSGSMKLFRVYANELLEPDDTEKLTVIAGEAENSLVLVTCENESSDGGYLNRRVVFAKPAAVDQK